MDVLNATRPAPLTHELELIYGDDGMCVSSWGALLIGVWWRPSTLREMEILAESQRALIEEQGMVSTLSVMRHELSLRVDEEMRSRGAEMAREFGPNTLGAATVVEASGMRANVFRSVVTGIYLTARTQTQYQVLSSIREGVQWVLKIPGTEAKLCTQGNSIVPAVQGLADRYN